MNPVTLYKCLADETRLKSVLLIDIYNELCVCDLTDALALSQPKISRHLAELRKCEILTDERRGKWVYYRINPNIPDWAKQVITCTVEQNSDYLDANIKQLNRCRDCC